MRRICKAGLVVFLALGLLPGGRALAQSEIQDDMIRQIVGFIEVALEQMDPARPGVVYPAYVNEHNTAPCYPMAWLYRNRHPENPFYGDTDIRDTAIDICDWIVGRRSTLEWPLYNLCQTFELLEDEIDPARKEQWEEYAEYYAGTRAIRPYFYTSFNHEAWNALAMLRAGQVFDRPEWVERSRGMMHQLVKIQNELGYFDEGPHHGPSMKYNHTQVTPMLLFADYAEDGVVLASAKKLADFMIRYSFPDGSPMSCFDGRQDWYMGYYSSLCYGFDRWPQGRTINRRLWQSRKKWDLWSPESRYFNLSDWYAYFGFGFAMDEYLSLRPEEMGSGLPQDTDGYLMYEESSSFRGGCARSHGWMVAMSAINSDIPRVAQSIYRLERQSRLDVWNGKTGLIVGGGSNIREVDVPLANFHVLTGYGEVRSDFGLLSGGEWHDKRAVYIPRQVEADIRPERQVLSEVFGQGDVGFEVTPLDESSLRVACIYDVYAVEKLVVQIPLIVYYSTTVSVDGRELSGGDTLERVEREVRLANSTTGTVVTVTPPGGARAALRPEIAPLRWYVDPGTEDRYHPFYQIRLLSVEIEKPDGKGRGEFMIEIGELR